MPKLALAPTRKQKFVAIERNIKSAFKRTPPRPPGKANMPTLHPTSVSPSSQGIPHPAFLPGTATTTRGVGAESKNKEGLPKPPTNTGRGQSRIYCLCHPTPTTAAPATPPWGQPELQDYGSSPRQGRALPSLPSRDGQGTPPWSSSAAARRRRGTTGRRWGRGLFLRAPEDPSSSPSPPPTSFAASRASSSPVVSCDQLIGVNFYQVRLTGRRELCSPRREEGAGVESDAPNAENGTHSFLGNVVSWRGILPYAPEVRARKDYNSQY